MARFWPWCCCGGGGGGGAGWYDDLCPHCVSPDNPTGAGPHPTRMELVFPALPTVPDFFRSPGGVECPGNAYGRLNRDVSLLADNYAHLPGVWTLHGEPNCEQFFVGYRLTDVAPPSASPEGAQYRIVVTLATQFLGSGSRTVQLRAWTQLVVGDTIIGVYGDLYRYAGTFLTDGPNLHGHPDNSCSAYTLTHVCSDSLDGPWPEGTPDDLIAFWSAFPATLSLEGV